MPETLHDVLSHSLLREVAGSRTFHRGREYFEYGYAYDLVYSEMGAQVAARVSGTEEYEVELWAENGSINWYCSCPHADDGLFCEHLVAVGLECLADPVNPKPSPAKTETRASTPNKTRASESRKSKRIRALINQIVAAANYGSGSVDLVTELLEALRALRASGESVEALHFTDLFFDRTGFGTHFPKPVARLMPDLVALHLELVGELRTDPAVLAERLIQIEVRGSHAYFTDAARRYADLLGKKGLTAYRSLLNKWIQGLDVLEPGGAEFSINHSSYEAVQRAAKHYAEFQNDPRIYISALSRDQRYANHLAQLSKVCRESGFMKEAWRLAKLACQHFPYAAEGYAAVAECHLAEGQPELATQSLLEQFSENPGLSNYRLLRKYATRLGHWDVYVEDALGTLYEASLRFGWGADYIDACLLEERPLDALEFAEDYAEEGRSCDAGALRRLGNALEADHSEEAVGLYLDQIDALVERTHGEAYELAIKWLRRAIEVLQQRRDGRMIQIVLHDLRERFKRKKGFTLRLNQMIEELELHALVNPAEPSNESRR